MLVSIDIESIINISVLHLEIYVPNSGATKTSGATFCIGLLLDAKANTESKGSVSLTPL
jgi:hypothetical protein